MEPLATVKPAGISCSRFKKVAQIEVHILKRVKNWKVGFPECLFEPKFILFSQKYESREKRRFLGMSDFRNGEKRRFYIMQREKKGGSIVFNIVHKREDIEL